MRVVIADNDPDALALLETDMRLEGHDIVGAADGGEETIAIVLAECPDALVVDYRMPPGPNGLDVAAAVLAEHPTMNVVIYSNYRDPRATRSARRVGATWLVKGNLRALHRRLAG